MCLRLRLVCACNIIQFDKANAAPVRVVKDSVFSHRANHAYFLDRSCFHTVVVRGRPEAVTAPNSSHTIHVSTLTMFFKDMEERPSCALIPCVPEEETRPEGLSDALYVSGSR